MFNKIDEVMTFIVSSAVLALLSVLIFRILLVVVLIGAKSVVPLNKQ